MVLESTVMLNTKYITCIERKTSNANLCVHASWVAFIEVCQTEAMPSECRLDGQGLHEHYDVLVQGPTIADLIAADDLVPPLITPPQGVCLDLTGVKKVLVVDPVN